MLQKTQWTMAATALAVGACLVASARPAAAQVRMHLTRGVKTTMGAGIVTPPSSPNAAPAAGIVIPTTSVTPTPPATTPAPSPAVAPKPTPAASPVVRTPPLVVSSPVAVKTVSAPQGFSPGPSLLGDWRLPLGRLVDRVGPAIIGDDGPTVQKVIAHH
jgi:hypothetical protein